MAENESVQNPEDQGDSQVTDPNEEVTAEGDPTEAAIEAAVAAKLVALQEQVREETRREIAATRERDRTDAEAKVAAEQLLNSFGATVREVRENLRQIKF